jgi:hypothetical protein
MKPVVRPQYRLPEEIDHWLTRRAEQNLRSKNAQLVAELRDVMRSEVKEREQVSSAGGATRSWMTRKRCG